MIDDFVQSEAGRKSDEGPLVSKIRSATSEIKALLAEVDDIKEKTAALPKLVTELDTAKKLSAAQSGVHKEIVAHRTTLGELTPQVAAAGVRAETITRVSDRLAQWTQKIDTLLENKPAIEPWPTQAGTADELADMRKREKIALSRMMEGLEQLREIALELERKKLAASTQRTGLENRARDIRQKIEEKQKGASALDKRIGDLTQQISVLKSLVELKKERDLRLNQLVQQPLDFTGSPAQGATGPNHRAGGSHRATKRRTRPGDSPHDSAAVAAPGICQRPFGSPKGQRSSLQRD